MSAALANRSLSTLKTELEFLRESDVISDSFYQQVMASLPERYQQGNPPAELKGGASMASTPAEKPPLPTAQPQPQPQRQDSGEYVEAMYQYAPQQPEDLGLHPGDKVLVLEHTSPDWWKGSCNGKIGMFPVNYVKPITTQRPNMASPAPSYQAAIATPPQEYNNGYPQYPNGSNNGNVFPGQQMQQMPAQQQQQPQQTQQPQQEHHHGAGGAAFKKFGSKLGNAAIFGAGATIGSDIVNSIF